MLMVAAAPLLAPPRRTWVKATAGVLLVVGIGVQLFGSSESFIDFYSEYFAPTARQEPSFYVLYSGQEVSWIEKDFAVLLRTPQGGVPISPEALPAPINDSIYVPQCSQWYAYPVMLSLGQHDWLWIHLLE